MSTPTTCVIAPAGPDRWTLSIDGTVLATADTLQHLQRLAELAHLIVERGEPTGLSARAALDLEEALNRRLPEWTARNGYSASVADLAALSTAVAQLVEHAPEAARRLLDRATGVETEGAPS